MSLELLSPDWPVASKVFAGTALRRGGHSGAPFTSLNPASHVGDEPDAVERNRDLLQSLGPDAADWAWLEQVHGTAIEQLSASRKTDDRQVPTADGSFTRERGQVCVVMTADCLPILLCNAQATQIAAVHAGWRGLHAGIIERALAMFDAANEDTYAWIGPSISRRHYQVDWALAKTLLEATPNAERALVEACVSPDESSDEHCFLDLPALARLRLQHGGVSEVYGGKFCSFADTERFYSYRRDGQTGRNATFISLTGAPL